MEIKGLFKLDDGGISTQFRVERNRGLKYIHAGFDKEGLRVRIPAEMPVEAVDSFLNNNRQKLLLLYYKWLKKSSSDILEDKELREIQYLGSTCSIELHEYPSRNIKVLFKEGSFHIYWNIKSDKKENDIKSALKEWFIKQAYTVISKKVKCYASIINVSYNNIKIKEQSTRWGSCSSKGNLNFNWKIIMAPEYVLDYVIVHEVCHLKYLNHSKEFWNLVASYMPDYEKAKKWLKEKGHTLGI